MYLVASVASKLTSVYKTRVGPAHRYLVTSATICRIDITTGCMCRESVCKHQGKK
jgi:hypothetical protein